MSKLNYDFNVINLDIVELTWLFGKLDCIYIYNHLNI